MGRADSPAVQRLPDDGPMLAPPQTEHLPPGTPSLESAPPWQEPLDALAGEVQALRKSVEKSSQPDPSRPAAKFTAQLQADAYLFDQDAANLAAVGDIPDGSAFRRARVGWTGDHEFTQYRVEFDAALPGRPSLLDVWAGVKHVPLLNYVRVGHFFEPFSLDRLTPNRYVTYLERNLGDQAFVPARNLGIATFNNSPGERITWACGLFFTGSDNFGDDIGIREDGAFTGRVTWLPWYDEASGGRSYLHLGLAGSVRHSDESVIRFRAQPEARLGAATPNVPFFVDTGNIPSQGSQLLGLEAAWVAGPFSVQSEYIHSPVDRIGGPDVVFNTWYVSGSWFLTGEHRPYRRAMPQGGVFDRVRPVRNFLLVRSAQGLELGPGAWEAAVRLSHLDLNDEDILGGELTNLTVGLNWYLTPYLRVSGNYIHAMLTDPDAGRGDADIFGLRVGYDF
jgi:phosphate-selective porin OprO/OprP